MFSSRKAGLAALLAALSLPGLAQQTYPNIGRTATAKEVAAWDIDVRPDFKGLPKGQGSVAKGMEVWESKCASCHGIFGESNEVFSPIVGGTTAQDVKTGRVARLLDTTFPGRTTLMKVSTVSTLWDYIHRAMPWTAPKSLSVEEVYGVTAYLLNLGGVVPDAFVLSHETMAEAQARLPNRLGMRTDHGLWPGKGIGHGKPDVQAVACMKNCSAEPQLASFLPDFARNAHGNLAEQNRAVGAQHGADTTQQAPASASPPPGVPTTKPAEKPADPGAAKLVAKYACTACHGVDKAIVGPAFNAIARKHAARADLPAYLTQKIRSGGQGIWGAIPMPAQTLPEPDAALIAQWIAGGAKR